VEAVCRPKSKFSKLVRILVFSGARLENLLFLAA
jgi:hypothetical protein